MVRAEVDCGNGSEALQRSAKFRECCASAGGSAVQVEDEVAESGSFQAVDDGVDGGALFGDEEHRLSVCGECRHEVGDGLALPGAGRSLHDQVGSSEGGV